MKLYVHSRMELIKKYIISNKQPPSITYFILNSKNFVTVLIFSNKHFFVSYYDQFGNPPHRFLRTIIAYNFRNKIIGNYPVNQFKTKVFLDKLRLVIAKVLDKLLLCNVKE